jgi:hypothetical protein
MGHKDGQDRTFNAPVVVIPGHGGTCSAAAPEERSRRTPAEGRDNAALCWEAAWIDLGGEG